MLWTILVILLVLWLLGVIGGVGGSLIHALLVIALIVLVGVVARILLKGCGRDEVVSFSCDEKENRLPHPQLARV